MEGNVPDNDPENNNNDDNPEDNNDEPAAVPVKQECKALVPYRRPLFADLGSGDASTSQEPTYNNYPVDVWHMIGRYINPEDVGNFAGICRATNEVAHSVSFWRNMYQRHYQDVPNLPQDVQQPLPQRAGLKTHVVRSLFRMYRPFALREIAYDPNLLAGYHCEATWTNNDDDGFYSYFFKMREPLIYSTNADYNDTYTHDENDHMYAFREICYNEFHGCKVLKISCECPASVFSVVGYTLLHASLETVPSYPSSRVRFWFGKAYRSAVLNKIIYHQYDLTIEEIVRVQLFNWWDAEFPIVEASVNYVSSRR